MLTMTIREKLCCALIAVLAGCFSAPLLAQDADADFKEFQLGCTRVSDACKKYNDSAAKEFRKKNIAWPPKDIYLRAFKSQNELELWARNNETTEYKLIKTYRICALSGALGPKRAQGDRQVPEGYYFIEDFNPKSDYYLSMQLSYPNYSDRLLGKENLGGDIYIHGGCVTIGCMPMTDDGIKELYTVCVNARINGQEFIPVHIFPNRMNKAGMNYLKNQFQSEPVKQQFWSELKAGYEYFEKYHKILPVMYTPEGKYVN